MTEYELFIKLCNLYDIAKRNNNVEEYVAINNLIIERWGRTTPPRD